MRLRPPGRLVLFVLFLIALTAVVVACAVVSAQETTGSENPPDGETTAPALPSDLPTRETFENPDTGARSFGPSAADYLRVFVGLAVVLVVIWVLSVLMKRFVTYRGLTGSVECLKVLYSLNLTPARSIHLVRLVDRVLLIGSGEGGLRTLSEITNPEEVSAILKELEFKGNFDLNPFREKLKTLMGEEGESVDLDTRQRKMKSALDRLKEFVTSSEKV